MEPQVFVQKVIEFVKSLNTGKEGEYIMCPNGNITLYASCFAAMTLHYLNAFNENDKRKKKNWANYIKSWQDPKTGRFIGPEIISTELISPKHDWNHVTMHLTAHALPAIHILGERPLYPLSFAHCFLDIKILRDWLTKRNWENAWLEGNNLLLIGQFLVYLRDIENRNEAQLALKTYFDWLDAIQDPKTGLWGTNGYCDIYEALYGAYHQLLVYHYCKRPVQFAEVIIDTTLSAQHPDGSFSRYGGGGTCEDLDGVDILVNLYKRTGYRKKDVFNALRKALKSILSKQMSSGGFINQPGKSFSQLGIVRTFVPENTPDMFSTWFRVHTIALICQVLYDHPFAKIPWHFNNIFSMGWHDTNALQQQITYSIKRTIKIRLNFYIHSFIRNIIWRLQKSLRYILNKLLK